MMGVMGAMLAKGASMGVIGPIEVGDAKLYNDGFAAGAKAQDPDREGRRELHRVVQRHGACRRGGHVVRRPAEPRC